jgi:long-chain acyl-CoA synthetase
MTTTAPATPASPTAPGGASPLGTATLPGLLLRRAAETPERVAVRSKNLGRWEELTWRDYAGRAGRVGLGLRALGIGAGDRVAIHSENRSEWLLADLGAQGLGAVTVGIYPTSPEAEVEYLLAHSESKVVVVEDQEQLDKTLAVRDRLPALERIVIVDTAGLRGFTDPQVLTFAELEALGAEQPAAGYSDAVTALDPDAVAIIVYTSGTTGPPKGAMLTHRNLLAAAEHIGPAWGAGPGDEVLSYLPLCHVAERLISLITALGYGYVVNFPESASTMAADIVEIQPTFFLGVPRVWEKMMAATEIRIQDASRLKRLAYRFFMARGKRTAARRLAGGRPGPGYVLGWLFVFRQLRRKMGLSRVRGSISGAAPIAPQVLEWFWALGVTVREGYGQTEGTGLGTVNPPGRVRMGTVGPALPAVELRIADDGEILVRSPGVFAGYHKNPEATAETVDTDGWLHTGDVGTLDVDGYLTITDRKKDIIITAGGKNISPSEIENKLKLSPYIREAVVIGDRRPYLTALLGIELDTVRNWATRQGLAFTTYADLSGKPEIRALLQSWVDHVNTELAQVETVKRFAMIPRELDHEEGELTATQKVKRAAISRMFEAEIEALYRAKQ